MTRTVVVRLLIAWLSNCVALLVAAAVIPAIGYGKDVGTLLLAGLILGVVNFVVRPAIVFLTLPAVILSLGLFLLVINALMLWLTSRIVDGFTVGGFWSTVGGALIVWIVNAALRRAQRSTQADAQVGAGLTRRPPARRAADARGAGGCEDGRVLLLVKLALAPALVVGSSLAGRRWGHEVSGLLVALPLVAGPILLITELEHGAHFASRAAAASLLGLVALASFVVVFARAARHAGWPIAVLAGWVAFLAVALAFGQAAIPAGVGLRARRRRVRAGAAAAARRPARSRTRRSPRCPPGTCRRARSRRRCSCSG